MDDEEYYSAMRKQNSPVFHIQKKQKFSEWNSLHGREDAEMLNERERENETPPENSAEN